MSAEADVRTLPDTVPPQVPIRVQNPAALDDALVRRLLRHAVVGARPVLHDTVAPFTGERATTLPISTEADVEHAFAMSRRAQRAWAQRTPRERARVLLRFHDLVLAQQAEVMDVAQIETGKARRDAYEELADCALTSRHYARVGPRMLSSERHLGVFPVLTRATLHHHAKGVVGIISPWNYPISLAVTDALPALLAGNGVVLRPDLQTTVTALRMVDLLVEAGLPEGLMNVVIGDGPHIGPHVVERADYVMFTGSTRVGRDIARRCGERLIACSLELGGKNAVVVRADADLERSAEIAERASFANAGQLCIGTERVLVHESIVDDFLRLFLARVEALRLVPYVGWGAGMGSLVSARQLEKVSHHVDDAVAKGARVLTGGQPLPDVGPFYYAPTVLADVTAEMAVCREETFGPVASVYTFRTDDDAVAMANDTEYGLNGAVLTRDTRAGLALARRIHAGTVNVNEAYGATWGSISAPMGGMKDSGLGRRHGVEGLMKYTEPQTVAVQSLIGFGSPFGRTDEQWAGLMTTAFKALKTLRVK
ncbi:succinic semialdehyde dehydrogenase [Longivirga aurantiaca]|uniref:Succinic semialdehyde dehydrogenase n=1 Tax=Longivirga aurantiaca TaxID=1837743 RepID=A0ABW1SYA1_9ACTN